MLDIDVIVDRGYEIALDYYLIPEMFISKILLMFKLVSENTDRMLPEYRYFTLQVFIVFG